MKYSPAVCEKRKQIKRYVKKLGVDTANKVIRKMTKPFRDFQQYENKGVSVENALGIPGDCRGLYVQPNFVLNQIEADTVKITDIYDEKVEFMWK